MATRMLLKAVRTARTYPIDNEICRRALAELPAHLEPALPLELLVTSQGFQIAGLDRVEEEDGRTGLAGLLFRDGIRRLELKGGLAGAELERLVTALAETIHPDDLSRDYVTLLWEADLPHVIVSAVDPFLDLDGDEEVLEGKPSEARADPYDDAEQDLPPPPQEAFKVSEADALRLTHEVSMADRYAPWQAFVSALFSTLASRVGERRLDEVALLIETTYHRSLAHGRPQVAAEVLDALGEGVPAYAADRARRMLERAVEVDHLRPVHVAAASDGPDGEHARRILGLLGPACAEAICCLVQEGCSEGLRSFYIELLAGMGSDALQHVVPLLDAENDDARALAIPVLSRIQHPEAARALLRALDRAEPSMKRDLVRAVAQQQDPSAAARILELALEGEDAGVRIIALRCLNRERHPGSQTPLLERAKSSGFRMASDEEKDLLFEALGRVSDGGVVPYLEGLLKVGLLRRSHPARWRRAARALARVDSADAVAALERGAASRNEDLARICGDCLRETRSSRR